MKRKLHDDLYICDTKKNTKCSKTNCHINGGECRHTTHKEYAVKGVK